LLPKNFHHLGEALLAASGRIEDAAGCSGMTRSAARNRRRLGLEQATQLTQRRFNGSSTPVPDRGLTTSIGKDHQ
jgi:hypothetical protein